ncbi:MAG: hypothetical protein IPP63_14185 [Chloracidobacterium sp.]|nr:hypothetical protein [Chloracidobacterium sp.]
MGTGGRGIISALWSSGLADISCRGRDRDLYGFFEVGGDVMLTSGALFFIVIFGGMTMLSAVILVFRYFIKRSRQ